MEQRTHLIEELDRAREKLTTALQAFGDEQEIYPGWTPKHLLAHIAGWDDAVLTALRAFARGDEFELPAFHGIDVYNAQSVETREMLRHDQVAREWEQVRQQVKDTLNQMPDEKFEQDFLFPWGGRGTIAQLIGIFIHHETEHAEEIEQIQQDKG